MNLHIPEDDRLNKPEVKEKIDELEMLYGEYQNFGKSYALLLRIAELHRQLGEIIPLEAEKDRQYQLKVWGEEANRLEAKRKSRSKLQTEL